MRSQLSVLIASMLFFCGVGPAAAGDAERAGPQFDAREVATRFARERLYEYRGRQVEVARKPVLATRGANPIQAFEVLVDGKQTNTAITVRGGVTGWTASGSAAIHFEGTPFGRSSREIDTHGRDAVIVRTRRWNRIEAETNATKTAESAHWFDRAALIEPSYPSPTEADPWLAASVESETRVSAPFGLGSKLLRQLFGRIVAQDVDGQ